MDTGLLGFAFHNTTLTILQPVPAEADASTSAGQLCDALLYGLVNDCPPDTELSASAASHAARKAIARWRTDVKPHESDSKAQILMAARSEFARRGYAATTIRDIAKAAGVPMGTMYRRVDSKEAVLHELLESYSNHMDDLVGTVMSTDSTDVELLDALAMGFVHAGRKFRKEFEILKYGWVGRESEADPFHGYYLHTQRRYRSLETILVRGTRSGALTSMAAPLEVAALVRRLLWMPFDSNQARAHTFLRESLFRGSLVRP